MANPAVIGKNGTISINGGALNGKLLNWKRTYSSKQAMDTGAGDDWEGRRPTVKDWEVTAEYELLLAGYTSYGNLMNTEASIALKVQASDPNAFFAATGLVTDDAVDLKFEDVVKGTITIKGDGNAPTIG